MRYIFGLGNYSMFDDSIGIRVIEHISENDLEDNSFKVIDLSANPINLFSYLSEDLEAFVIVDTALFEDRKYGETKIFGIDDVISQKKNLHISSHEGDIIQTIIMAKELGYPLPDSSKIQFLGIKPELIKDEFGISESLDNLPEYSKQAIDLIKKI